MVNPKMIVDLTNDNKNKPRAICLSCHRDIYGNVGDIGICECGLGYEIVAGTVSLLEDDEYDYGDDY